MSEYVKKLLTLYENGIIDGDVLNTALKALNAPPPQEPQKKLSQIKQEKDVAEKRKGGNKEGQKLLQIKKMKHPESPHFSLWIKPNVVLSERMKFQSSAIKTP